MVLAESDRPECLLWVRPPDLPPSLTSVRRHRGRQSNPTLECRGPRDLWSDSESGLPSNWSVWTSDVVVVVGGCVDWTSTGIRVWVQDLMESDT